MKVAGYGRAEQNNALHFRTARLTDSLHNFIDRSGGNHCILTLSFLPTAACASAPGTAASESPETAASAPASSTTSAKTASTPAAPASAKCVGEQNPKQDAAQR